MKIVSVLLAASLFLSACGNIPATSTAEMDTTLTPTPASTLTPGPTPTFKVVPTPEMVPTPVELQAGYGTLTSWFELYFTNPISPLSSQGTGGVDEPLVAALDAARLSIDVAAYSLSLNSVRGALIRAHDRGVTVRVVMESTNMDRSDPQKMIEAGIRIVGDNRQGLMHDKFIIIDRSEVWMGSMNFTDSGAYDDNNNLVRIRSEEVALDYTTEFEEMFTDDKFGPDIVAQTPNPTVTINGVRMDIFFSPDDRVLAALIPLLESAQESIYFLAYSFTSNQMGEIIREKAAEGLTIAGVMDAEQVQSNQGTEFDPFLQAELDVRRDGIDGLMHHKVFIIDKQIVAFGSYNFSQSAEERNDENLIIVYSPVVAEQFLLEFQRVWEEAQSE
ncbi:MAG TPA: phospholipase D-like domain-containing protein [Anaerolineales bacterium]|nr:phospholipase D-like domain-containing protein [Anaerolineales bacterium]